MTDGNMHNVFTKNFDVAQYVCVSKTNSLFCSLFILRCVLWRRLHTPGYFIHQRQNKNKIGNILFRYENLFAETAIYFLGRINK